MLRNLLIGSLIATGACEDKVADRTENAAERVTEAASQLRHEQRQLAVEVVDRGAVSAKVTDVNRGAGELARAQDAFEQLKALRVASLRAEHSVAASQPLLIQAISAEKPLSPAMRARLDDNLRIYRSRLAATRDAIRALQFVTAAEWERRDDDLVRMMAGLHLARDASWQVLDDDHREGPYPGI